MPTADVPTPDDDRASLIRDFYLTPRDGYTLVELGAVAGRPLPADDLDEAEKSYPGRCRLPDGRASRFGALQLMRYELLCMQPNAASLALGPDLTIGVLGEAFEVVTVPIRMPRWLASRLGETASVRGRTVEAEVLDMLGNEDRYLDAPLALAEAAVSE